MSFAVRARLPSHTARTHARSSVHDPPRPLSAGRDATPTRALPTGLAIPPAESVPAFPATSAPFRVTLQPIPAGRDLDVSREPGRLVERAREHHDFFFAGFGFAATIVAISILECLQRGSGTAVRFGPRGPYKTPGGGHVDHRTSTCSRSAHRRQPHSRDPEGVPTVEGERLTGLQHPSPHAGADPSAPHAFGDALDDRVLQAIALFCGALADVDRGRVLCPNHQSRGLPTHAARAIQSESSPSRSSLSIHVSRSYDL